MTAAPPTPREPTPADAAFSGALLYTLPRRFAEAAAPAEAPASHTGAIFTLRQVALYTWQAVEWRVVTDTRTRKAPIMALRAQFDEAATRERFRAASAADPGSAVLEPVVHRWECRLPESMLTWAMKQLREVKVPLSPGVASSAPYTFPICTLDAGRVYTALHARVCVEWCNPRAGPWDPLITFFHTLWHRLECALDGRRPMRPAPIPPSGGFDDYIRYGGFLREHPLVRQVPVAPAQASRSRKR